MSIQSLVKKIKQNIEKKKAIEKGNTLTNSGQQQVATTSGYANVPAKATDTGKSYNVTPPPKNPTPSNRGGGGGSSGSSNNQQSSLSNPTEGAKSSVNKDLVNVRLNKSGSVTVGNKTFTGNAYIQSLGTTANQYKQDLKNKFISQGNLNKKNSGSGRWNPSLQTGEQYLDNGDIIVYDKFGEPVGVKSKFFGQSMSIDNYDKAIDRYNNKIDLEENKKNIQIKNKTIIKSEKDFNKKGKYTGWNTEYYADGTFKQTNKKGQVFYGEYYIDKNGEPKILQSGGVVPVTPEDVFVVASGGAGLAKLGVKKGLTFALSSVITKPVNEVYENYSPQPKTNVGKFVKASITGLAISRSPTLGEAYLADITKALITKPVPLAKSAVQNPAETLGFAVGGGLLGKGFNLIELQFRGIKVEKVNLPGYGEVIIQKIPKYKDIIWVKGAFSQTEKLNVMDQINRLKGNKERVFVQVAPNGIPSKVFSNTKNLGFEVKEVSNPMRGLYQAPPFKFLEKYKDLINTNYGAAGYYAGGSRRTIIPNPLDILRSNVKDTFSNQRPFEYIERTYKEVNTPKWVEETARAMQEGRGIPKKYQALFNKLYKEFLDKPIEFQKGIYKGLEKEKLLNYLNLKSRGNGVKLKVYSALLEYQNKNKVKLAGGAENLSGILPYGAESQIVRALGTRFFAKSIKDLRKGVKPSVGRKIVELITGTKRGQKTAMIDGFMVEIQPVRSFDSSLRSRGKVKSDIFNPLEIKDNVVKDLIGERRRERPTTSVPRPFLSRDNSRINRNNTRPVYYAFLDRGRSENPLIPRREDRPPRVNVRTPIPRADIRRPRVDIARYVAPRPREPRVNPPRRRKKTPLETIKWMKTDRGKKYRRNKDIKKPQEFMTLPTVFEQLQGGIKKGERAKRNISGFEAMRFA